MSTPEPDLLAAALGPVLGGPVAIDGLTKLTGGASRETWAFAADGTELILRRDPPRRPTGADAMRREADAMQACERAGLKVPSVLLHDDGTHFGTAGIVMGRVPGETIARRILRDEEFAPARRALVGELGSFLAGFHALDPSEVPGVEDRDLVRSVWDMYERLGQPNAVFEKAYAWLVDHVPPRTATTLVHGDLRLGNLIVGPDGLAAVIDWELVHLGDPMEDLAWLCLKAWRFGERPEVAGLGTVDELFGAYEAAGGRPVDRASFHWWLVHRTLTWGIGCLVQAANHLSGNVRSVDLAAVGRRAAEQEWDLIELLAPDAARAALDAPLPVERPDDDRTFGRPTARELLATVREFLTDDVMPSAKGGLGYQARVAANILAMVERELAHERIDHGAADDWATLALQTRDRVLVASPKHLSR